jgi:hypothetical protein
MLIGLLITTLLMTLWDFSRHASVSFWQQGFSDNDPGRLIRANELLPRAESWASLLDVFTGSPLLNVLLLGGLTMFLLYEATHSPTRAALADFVITGFVVTFLAVYWLLAFPVWDRYLVPLMPLLALLAGRMLVKAGSVIVQKFSPLGRGLKETILSSLIPLLFSLLILPSTLTAMRSGYPIGGDHGAHDGIDAVTTFARTLPWGTVFYDHWLSWELNYYLFDTLVYVSWFPTPDALATDLNAFGHTSPRYMVVPSWEADTEIHSAAQRAGFTMTLVQTTYRRDGAPSFFIYRFDPQP